MMTVHTDAGLWVVPSLHALWVPAGIEHDLEMIGGAPMRAIYFQTSLTADLPESCRIMLITPLLRELVQEVMRRGTLDRRSKSDRCLMDVLTDQLGTLPLSPIDLRTPVDPRAARAAELVKGDLAVRRTLAQVSDLVGASSRTIERLFRTETGLSFGAWAQRARLLGALQVLARGASVGAASHVAGYETSSAFVAAFRRVLGTTPGRYFRGS